MVNLRSAAEIFQILKKKEMIQKTGGKKKRNH